MKAFNRILLFNILSFSMQGFAASGFPEITEKENVFFERAGACRGMYIAKYLSGSIGFVKKRLTAQKKLEQDYGKLNCSNIAKELEAVKKEYEKTGADIIRRQGVDRVSSLKLTEPEKVALYQMTVLSNALKSKKRPAEVELISQRKIICSYLKNFSGDSKLPFFEELKVLSSCWTINDDYKAIKENPKYAGSSDIFGLPIWQPPWQIPADKAADAQKHVVMTGLTKAEAQNILQDYPKFLQGFTAVSLPDGLVLKEVKPSSVLKKLGFESGDVVFSINREPFNSLDQLLFVYFAVLESGHLHISVKRKNEYLLFQIGFLAPPPVQAKPIAAPVGKEALPQPPSEGAKPTAKPVGK